MRSRRWRPEELAANRNLSGGVAAVAAACAGVAQASGAPLAVRIGLGLVVLAAAVAGLSFHLLERRAPGTQPVADRPVPRADFNYPEKFVNRKRELADLDCVLERAERGEGPVIAVLGGLPGVGKSAVGRHWANQVRERFTDGDLVAEFAMRRRGEAVDVSALLAEFIRVLGPPDAVIPPTVAERVERFRALTYDRKLLVLLDDVSEAAQVHQLRPTGKHCVVVATSYRDLEELYYQGAEFVPVDPLSDDRAEDLLVKMAGEFGPAFEQHPAETHDLIRFCGGLALPLCVCAARLLLGRGRLTLGGIVTEVADEQRRLDYLAGKGEYAGAAVFGFAYADLPAEQRLTYRRLGLHPGRDILPVHAAVLAEVSLSDARQQLTALADTHLLEPREDGGYGFHDLVRLHARESVARDDPEVVREDRIAALVDWYRAALRKADWALMADRLRLVPDEPIDAPHLPVFTDRESVFKWLEAERSNVRAILHSAHDREWDDRVWQMVESLWLFHYNRRHYEDWIEVTEMGIESARRAHRVDAEARLRTQLAWALVEFGRFDRVHAELDRANRIVPSTGNAGLMGSVREFTGACYLMERRYDVALRALADAREEAVRSGSDRGIALQDYFIGWALIGLGRYEEALEALRPALDTMRRMDDQMFVGRLLLRVGQATLRLSELGEAAAALREGLEVFLHLGMRVEEAEVYETLAAVADVRADAKTATAWLEQARAIYRALGHPRAAQLVAGSVSEFSTATN